MNWQPVTPPRRWRYRRARRIAGVVLLLAVWLAGIALPTRELMSADLTWSQATGSVAVIALVWTVGLALGQPWRRKR